MTYLALNQGTAEWLLGKQRVIDAINEGIVLSTSAVEALSVCELVEGPIRIAANVDRKIVAIWNVDYLSGTGEEPWGFIKLDGELGLRAHPEISQEVLERCCYLLNQRLQGLIIEGAFIHRAHGNGAHTCLAGRGSAARQFSLAYFEKTVDADEIAHRAMICVGPAFDFSLLGRAAVEAGDLLPALVAHANSLIVPGRKRAVADADLLASLRGALKQFTNAAIPNEFEAVEVTTGTYAIQHADQFRAVGLTYDQWITPESPLSDIQRRILLADAIEHHPLRIVGPGGSGKTLLMQLLALRRLHVAAEKNVPTRVLYITHNSAMAQAVAHRFDVLDGGFSSIRDADRVLDITTLSEYGRRQLDLEYTAVIDADAFAAKQFQLEQIELALHTALEEMPGLAATSKLFAQVEDNDELFKVLAKLVMAEISTGIKGHGLENDKRRYVQSERRLSRLHGIMSPDERQVVFHAFELYNREVFEGLEVLDTDDIALSLLGRLRTPIWELKRRTLGYDFIFVDETQLFNENERRVLSLLTKGAGTHVPIVLALDEAQDVFGQSQSTAGLATLGIPDIANESLASIHRSTRAIIQLAFFVIQRSTDLFGPDFPDFTGIAELMEPDTHPLAAPPRVEQVGEDSRSLGRALVKRIRELRKANLRRIAVICHAEAYWDAVLGELKGTDLPLVVLLDRGQKLPTDAPIVVFTRPIYSGGQEFDAVILVGLEQGVVPPRVVGNDALAAAVEQQALREIYLAVTRARYRLLVLLSSGASPTAVIQDAETAGLLLRAANAKK